MKVQKGEGLRDNNAERDKQVVDGVAVGWLLLLLEEKERRMLLCKHNTLLLVHSSVRFRLQTPQKVAQASRQKNRDALNSPFSTARCQ